MNDTPTKHKTKKIIVIITMILLLLIGGVIVVIREINHYVDTHTWATVRVTQSCSLLSVSH